MKKISVCLCFCFCVLVSQGAIRLPRIFGDSMVLQRDQPIPVWGWADKGETVTLQFHNQTKKVKAGKDGKWKLVLNPESAGGPYTLSVSGKSSLILSNILVGDVWVCSGQSNMEWPVASSNNAAAEIASAHYPQIRHFKVTNSVADVPKDDLLYTGSWKSATPENVGAFTAIGYFFARELQKQLGVPIGLLNTTWGGTDVETWTSREAFESSPEFKDMIAGVRLLNLDSAEKLRKAAMLKTLEQTQGKLPDAATAQTWSGAAIDDGNWAKTNVPGVWETSALPDLDGVVWFRKTFMVTAANAGKGASLNLAMIDDADETYVNGTKVGSTTGYNAKRQYNIPAGILKEGKNTIAVRVSDTGGGGGIYGDSADVSIIFAAGSQVLSGAWAYRVEKMAEGAASINPNSYPSLLYNAMIHPLIPFAMKGVIWYQGENNAGRAFQYRNAFPLLINDWRKRWGSDFPFYFVQLASFDAGGGNSAKGSNWAELREAQTQTLNLPHTGMVVTTDIGEAKDIHPRNKQDVGLRMAAVALHEAYGKNNVAAGPTFQAIKQEGNKIIVSFTNGGAGLHTTDKYGYIRGFEVAGADQKFYYAKAELKGNTVVVYADSVSAPVAVRYAWADDAGDANLFNKEGFPAVPFRTDTWKGITENARYRDAR